MGWSCCMAFDYWGRGKKVWEAYFPHPCRYYVKDYSYDRTPPFVPTVNQIPAKFRTTAEEYNIDNKEEVDIYKCDLCRDVLKNEEEYDSHITDRHLHWELELG